MRHGLLNNWVSTLEEMDKQLRMTRERLRQIEVKALHKLK